MYCPNCGAELKFSEAEICPTCGVRIKEPPTSKEPILVMNAGTTNKFRDNTCEYGCSIVWVVLCFVAGLLCIVAGLGSIFGNPIGALILVIVGVVFFAVARFMYKRTQ